VPILKEGDCLIALVQGVKYDPANVKAADIAIDAYKSVLAQKADQLVGDANRSTETIRKATKVVKRHRRKRPCVAKPSTEHPTHMIHAVEQLPWAG